MGRNHAHGAFDPDEYYQPGEAECGDEHAEAHGALLDARQTGVRNQRVDEGARDDAVRYSPTLTISRQSRRLAVVLPLQISSRCERSSAELRSNVSRCSPVQLLLGQLKGWNSAWFSTLRRDSPKRWLW